MATHEKKGKPSLLDRLRAKRQEKKQRAAEHARRGAKDPSEARRGAGSDSGFGVGM
jgi:hypothetical protein